LHQLDGNKNLLGIDNAEEDIETIKNLLPPAQRWQILLTSRLVLRAFKELPLDKLGVTNALLLFKEHYKKTIKPSNETTLRALLRGLTNNTNGTLMTLIFNRRFTQILSLIAKENHLR
jgi:hypothetical protein